MSRRITRILVLVLLCLAMVSLWSWGRMTDQRRSAARAAEDLALSRATAGRIEQLRQRPSLGTSREPHQELSRRIEQAAAAAQLGTGSLERIGSEQQRRLSDSVAERSRPVFLRQVTLRQLMTFMHTLTEENPGLQIGSLRLSAPRGEEGGELWRAEMTLSYWTDL
jgi:hypothetical protein